MDRTVTRLVPGVFTALLLVFLDAFHAPAAMAKTPTTPSERQWVLGGGGPRRLAHW
jgi:hypothetical protein